MNPGVPINPAFSGHKMAYAGLPQNPMIPNYQPSALSMPPAGMSPGNLILN